MPNLFPQIARLERLVHFAIGTTNEIPIAIGIDSTKEFIDRQERLMESGGDGVR